MLGNLLKATIGLVIETPIAVVADALTLGGAINGREESYTSESLGKVIDNISESTQPSSKDW